STIPSIGASGAISGVMGAYMLLFPKSRIIMLIPLLFIPFFFEISAFFYLAMWFFIQLTSGWQNLAAPTNMGGVAFWAHIGGFLAGMLLHRLFLDRKYHEKIEQLFIRKYPRHEIEPWRRGQWY
ncbi:MAG: rhomboid family intramembrane serine protease, partial [Bacteroidetes bacterium]